jgi:hypothetical protein
LARVQIEQLACCDPAGIGLHMTHWSTRTLAKAAVREGIVPTISHTTVSLILRGADLQPHRSRYWKTPRLDAAFVERASKILWCYEMVEQLHEHDEVLICFDEKPNLQALSRSTPTVAMKAGRIERQEFEYIRHGTVNFAAALVVWDGKMRGWCLEKNDSDNLIPALDELFDEHRAVSKVHLIWDGGPSHISEKTTNFLRGRKKKVRVLLTPAHASWLNQAELLLRAFSAPYLSRGDWASRDALRTHLNASWIEYNELLAHPFHWSWTRRNLRDWVSSQGH